MNLDNLLLLYSGYDKVYGPYTRKNDGRQHICLTGPGMPKKTISYPKALVESNIGRRLTNDETIDHHDRNHENNSIDNLIVKSRKLHCYQDATRVHVETVECPVCGTSFTPTRSQRNKNKAGPFCTRRCAGIYGKQVQCGADKLNKTVLDITYYKLDKK